MKAEKIKRSISLGYSLAKANFKLRNEGSYLGIFWYLLSPLSFFIVILFVRGAVFSGDNVPYYPLYLLIGLTMFNFFNQLVGISVKLVESNAQFIKSIKIPHETFVVAAVFQCVFSHAFEIALIAAFFIYFHVSLVGIFFYMLVFAVYALFSLGVCFIAATLGAFLNDLGNIWAILSQLLFFLTPVFYVVSPGSYIYLANLFNPLFYFLTAARDVSIYRIIPAWWMMAVPVAVSFCLLFAGVLVFDRYKRRFAEMV